MAHRLRKMLLSCVILMLLLPAANSLAAVPYDSGAYDSTGRKYLLQPAYLPESVIGFNLLDPDSEDGEAYLKLNAPEDLFVDGNGDLYIADTNNNRIIHLDSSFAVVRILGDADGTGKLERPHGIFVDGQGKLYIADTGNKRIVVFDAQGRVEREYGRPDSPYLPEGFQFEPTKLVVDARGYLYVAIRNGYQGLVLLEPETGEFEGFFGANRVEFRLFDVLKRRFFTEDQLAKELAKLPGTVSNVVLGNDGFVYTTSIGVDQGQIKRLGFSGRDLLGEKIYGERQLVQGQERLFVDLAVDSRGMMTAIDAQSGQIYQYDAAGEVLFAFGARNQGFNKQGMIDYPSSIAVSPEGKLYVMDRTANAIHVLAPSEFALKVQHATELFLQGHYQESKGPWEEVLRLNGKFDRAHLGIAKSHYKQGDWQAAMAEYRLAGNVQGYSDAFWQVRLGWLQQHFALLAAGVIGAFLIWWAVGQYGWPRLRGSRLWKRVAGIRYLAQLGQAMRLLRHPVSGFWELRYEGKGSIASAATLVILAYAATLGSRLFTGYVFSQQEAKFVDPFMTLLQVAVPFLTWVIANYLVSSVTKGQGRLVDVLIGSSYALTPYILLALPLAALSNVLTLGEAVIYSTVQWVMIGWTVFLFYVGMREIHNFDLGETLGNLLLSIICVLLIWVLVFMLFSMSTQVIDFGRQLYEEVSVRG